MADRIVLATIGAAHGVKGEVRIKSFTAEPTAIANYGPLRAADGRTFEIERLRVAKGDMLVVKLKGIDDRDTAEALNGMTLHVERRALPEPDADEFYHADLIGMAAHDPAGTTLGTVTAIHDFGAGPVLDIAAVAGGSLLVSFTKDAVPDVNIAAGRLVVVPPTEIEGETPRSEQERSEQEEDKT